MKKVSEYPLTYFTNRTRDELDVVIEDLKDTLSKEEIAKLFVEDFKPKKLLELYTIAITDKLVDAVNRTLKYDIDTEMLIRYIYDKVEAI